MTGQFQKGAVYLGGKINPVLIGLSPLPVRVTTRIITFLVGNPYKPPFPLLLGGGTTQCIDITSIFGNTHFGKQHQRLKSKSQPANQIISRKVWGLSDVSSLQKHKLP